MFLEIVICLFFRKMKRKAKAVSSQRSSREATSLLKWVREIKTRPAEHVEVSFCEEDIHAWDVIFTAEMFASAGKRFEFSGDNGWSALTPDLYKIYDDLVKCVKKHGGYMSQCYQFQGEMYQADVYSEGCITQTNLRTDAVRPIRYRTLQDDIKEWFNKYHKDVTPGVHMKLTFPPNFPLTPPFVRVVCPRFEQYTAHVTIGGSMCTPMLTMDEWKSDIPPTVLLLHLRTNIIDGEGKINMTNPHLYSELEAREAFMRSSEYHKIHGWK